MSMFTKFLEWQAHLHETATLKKSSQVASLVKTLKWGIDNAPQLTAEVKEQVEMKLGKLSSLKSLSSEDIAVAVEAYNIVAQSLSEGDFTGGKPKAGKLLIEAAGDSGKLLVIDFEMVCDDTEEVDGEIIEFGACVLDINRNEVIDTFTALTRPTKVDALSTFCTKLTGITNHEMEKLAIEFGDAAKQFDSLIVKHDLKAVCQWGCGDMKRLKKDYLNHNLADNVIATLKVIDLKKPFSDSFGCRPRIGLKKALAIAGLERGSAAHRALPDAIETAKLVSAVIARS